MKNQYIIIDTKTHKALYGIENQTLLFSTYDNAYEIALQFFRLITDFIIIEIKI